MQHSHIFSTLDYLCILFGFTRWISFNCFLSLLTFLSLFISSLYFKVFANHDCADKTEMYFIIEVFVPSQISSKSRD